MPSFIRPLLFISAPHSIGALFFIALFAFGSCRERASPSWPGSTLDEEHANRIEALSSEDSDNNDEIGLNPPSRQTSTGASEVRFIAHNLRNWLTMDVSSSQGTTSRPKPDEEKQATTTLLARHQPDILGVSEIGQPADLHDLTQRLESAGLSFPHIHHTGGSDPVRHLALLSRFPIISSRHHESLRYQIDGQSLEMSRGILDITLDTPAGNIRFLGVHLKSKRKISWADEAKMRLAEAHLLRALIDDILTRDPATKLIVYGDFNDTRNSPALRRIRGPANGPKALKMAGLRDSDGESWTYHWQLADIYSRIDFILLSQAVRSSCQWSSSYIIDDPETSRASDHRPLVLTLQTTK